MFEKHVPHVKPCLACWSSNLGRPAHLLFLQIRIYNLVLSVISGIIVEINNFCCVKVSPVTSFLCVFEGDNNTPFLTPRFSWGSACTGSQDQLIYFPIRRRATMCPVQSLTDKEHASFLSGLLTEQA